MSQDWTVTEVDGENSRTADSRSEAEEIKRECEQLGMDVEIVTPGEDDDAATDGGTTTVEPTTVEPASEPAQPAPELDSRERELAERTVSDDPLTWMPSDFVDEIDGTTAINRKGFEVLGHFYDVDVHSDLEVAPEETDFEYCRVKACATTPDGRQCEAYGSAHVDRDDDATLLLEMADTRARKRALSIATGVGAVAVEELKSEADA